MARKEMEFLFLNIVRMSTNFLTYLRWVIFLSLLEDSFRDHNTHRRKRYSMIEKLPMQVEALSTLVSDTNSACYDELRITRDIFGRLYLLLEFHGLRPSKYVSVPEMVASFLGILAHHKKQRLQKHKFKRSTWTISHHFHSVLSATLNLHCVLLVKPEPITADTATEKFKYFENCLGALDGTYIHVKVPQSVKARYRDRKHKILVNVLGVCDQHCNFIYMLTGWEGSAADGRVLRDAMSGEDAFRVPRGCYYLCDNGYTNCEGFLTPYRNTRYHLREWGPGNLAPRNSKEYYNMKHSGARNVIERAWGIMKLRWGVLRSPSFYPIEVQNRIILATALLHNFIRKEMSTDPLDAVLDNIGQEDNGDGDGDGDEEPDFISTINSTDAWNNWRDGFANSMWNAR